MNNNFLSKFREEKKTTKKQLSTLIDSVIYDRLDNLSNQFGHGSKKRLIENALVKYFEEFEPKKCN